MIFRSGREIAIDVRCCRAGDRREYVEIWIGSALSFDFESAWLWIIGGPLESDFGRGSGFGCKIRWRDRQRRDSDLWGVERGAAVARESNPVAISRVPAHGFIRGGVRASLSLQNFAERRTGARAAFNLRD